MVDLDELIAEARECAPGDDATELAVIVHRLADALEEVEAERDEWRTEHGIVKERSSTRFQAYQQKKRELRAMEIERDAALARIAELEEALTKECRDLASTTAHTAAAMGSLRHTMGEAMVKLGYEGLRQKLSRAEARIAEAEKLHQCFVAPNGYRWCSGCSTDEYPEDWPCPTAVALGLNEGEER